MLTASQSKTQPSLTPQTHKQVAKQRILLADDDAEMRAMVAWALEREGYILQECHDGDSLKKWIDRSHSRSTNVTFDLVISDIRMPGLSGLEVLEDVQTHGGKLPVILVSAFCDSETEDQARRFGAAALLPKPFEMEDLVAKVKALLPDPSSTARSTARGARDRQPHQPSFPLDIVFRHRSADAALNSWIVALAGRLERHADLIQNCRVVIEPTHLAGLSDQHVNLVVSTKTHPIVVNTISERGRQRLGLAPVPAPPLRCRRPVARRTR